MESGKGDLVRPGEGPPDPLQEREASPPPPYYPTPLPRSPTHLTPNYVPTKQLFHSQPTTLSWSAQDPRSASTESLVPPGSPRGKRTLLIIYIHGFLGDETSFQSFPAHVHNEVTRLLQDTHVVHTKIYPKYRSRRAIQFARDDFSKWLAPHESPDTDVILCGHSMGGLLSGEVALMPNNYPQGSNALLHRLVGTVNFDVPFLGMHPGVISSGISSLFRPTPKSPEATAGNPMEQQMQGGPSTTSLSTVNTQESQPQSLQTISSSQSGSTLSIPQHDPNYDPPFVNDNNLPIRKGWDSTIHFLTKHSDHIVRASRSYVTSHLEFGGAMADYKGLQTRYKALRALADRENMHKPVAGTNKSTGLVRFVNFYTASTGIPKAVRSGRTTPTGRKSPGQSTTQLAESSTSLARRSPSASPVLSPEVSRTSADASPLGLSPSHSRSGSSAGGDLATLEPIPHEPETDEPVESQPAEASEVAETTEEKKPELDMPNETVTSPSYPELPPLPTLPERPSEFDPAAFVDKDSRKVAEKDHERQMKAYSRSLKDREKAVKERGKILEKREKAVKAATAKDEKAQRAAQKESQREAKKEKAAQAKEQQQQEQKEKKDSDVAAAAAAAAAAEANDTPPQKLEKKKKDRKFCLLPPRGRDGQRDPLWERVYMVDVDEVGAHCGLFAAERPHYEAFVHDVGALVERWVREADNERVAGASLARASFAT